MLSAVSLRDKGNIMMVLQHITYTSLTYSVDRAAKHYTQVTKYVQTNGLNCD